MKYGVFSTIGAIGAVITSFFGGWSEAMTTLIIFMAIDYLTGLIVAAVFKKSKKSKSGSLKSSACFKGLCKKGAELLIVLVACRLDITLQVHYIQDAVIIAFISSELLSIVENVGLMGVKLPPIVVKAVDLLNTKAEEKENEN